MRKLNRVLATAVLAVLGWSGVTLLAAQQAPPPSGPAAAPTDAPAYVVQSGDELSIKVFAHAELDDTVTVRPDGRISAALIDEVQAAGLSVTALDQALTTRYGKFFRDPEVTVIIRRIANLKVFVGGEVGAPGVIPINGELTVLGAVFQAGGFRSTARTDSVILIRPDKDQKPVATKLDLKRLEKNQALMTLQPFDVVFVPMSKIAKADRFVDQYIRQLNPIALTAGFSYIMGSTVAVR